MKKVKLPKTSDVKNELIQRIRNGNYILLELKGWKVSYPYPASKYSGFMMWKDEFSVSVIVGERLTLSLTGSINLESDCCYSTYETLPDLIDHLSDCERLKNMPNWENRI